MIYINDLARDKMRAIHNNLSPKLGLPNSFALSELHAIEHPDDVTRQREYTAQRTALGDADHLTWTARIRDVEGLWRTISARVRVFSRRPDGAPERMLAVVFEVSEFDTVYDALKKVTRDLERTETREREHLGRELHDSVSQVLVGAKLILSSMRREGIAGEGAAKLEDVSRTIDAALDEIRTLSFLLHPPDLKRLGLSQALRGLCAGFSQRTSLPIECRFADDADGQSDPVAMTLFRITQEALMNVHRHARASRAEVRLSRSRGHLELEVADDGIGLPGTGPGIITAGVGIAGMRARMTNLGGELVLANRNPGLRVLARVPAGLH